MKKKILVVEDELIVALALKKTLQTLGYEVVGSEKEGYAAIQTAGETMPDLILMDIHLKGDMDGIEAAETIATLYSIPVIYLTAHSDEDTLSRALRTQPYGYLIKPFKDRELYTSIEMAIHKHQVIKKTRNEVTEVAPSVSLFEQVEDAIVATDSIGTIVSANSAFEEFFGWKKEDVIGRDLYAALGIGKRGVAGIFEETGEISDDGIAHQVWPDQIAVTTAEGKRVYVTMNAGFIRGTEKSFEELIFVFREKEKKEASSKGRWKAEEALEILDIPVFIINREMKIEFSNTEFEDLCRAAGFSEYQLSRPIYEISGFSLFGPVEDFKEAFISRSPVVRVRKYRKNNQLYIIRFTYYPLIKDEAVEGVVVAMYDITAEKEAQNAEESVQKSFSSLDVMVNTFLGMYGKLKPPLYTIISLSSRGASKDSLMQQVAETAVEATGIITEIDMELLKYEQEREHLRSFR